MNCESIRIKYSDGYQAFSRLWVPTSPRGGVIYLHGIQSHGLWFAASAQRMAEVGYAVLLPDRRGSGRNAQDRGHTPSARRLIRDVGECCDELHVRTGFEKFHLVGVSWGGKLALAFHNSMPRRVGHLTLIAPGLFPKVDLPAWQKVRVGVSALFAKRALFDIPLQQAELFTENPVRQAFIRNDPLALRQVTASFLIASRRLDGLAQRARSIAAGPPVRLFLAGQDRIIENVRTRHFVESLAWPDRRIIEYPQAHHTLEFELDNERFMADLISGNVD